MPPQDPHEAATRAHRAAVWADRLATAHLWLWALLVGVPLLALCGCCAWPLVN